MAHVVPLALGLDLLCHHGTEVVVYFHVSQISMMAFWGEFQIRKDRALGISLTAPSQFQDCGIAENMPFLIRNMNSHIGQAGAIRIWVTG